MGETVTGEGHGRLVWRYALLLGVATLVILFDQVTKRLVSSNLQGRPPISLFGGLVYLEYARNTGAAFSVLPSGGAFFEAAAAIACVAILLLYPRVRGSAWISRVALGLVLGGAAGNLVDRVRLGYVVDFVDLRWWPVFNVADSAIVVGALLLAFDSLRRKAPSK